MEPTFERSWIADAPTDLPSDVRQLAAVMERLHDLSDQLPLGEKSWMAGDCFTCDGGALAAALAARRMRIPSVGLFVGLYWHSEPEVRAAAAGEVREPGVTDEEWADYLDQEVTPWMEEHHHWVVVHAHTDQAILIDPNGPAREEPYLQRAADAFNPLPGRAGPGLPYEWGDHVENLVYDPDDDWDEIADSLYPGLRACLGQALTEAAGR